MASNILYKLEGGLSPQSDIIQSPNLPISPQVLKELQFWKGKKESHSAAYPRLKNYWSHIKYGKWSPSGTPWSAAFISYVLRGTGFKGAGAHYVYVQNVLRGQSAGWKAFSIPKNKGKIKLAVGDVLVRPRSGGYTNTHGDVVFKIANGKAYLAGGNLGDTAKTASVITVDKNGIAQNIPRYMVLLKKNAGATSASFLPSLPFTSSEPTSMWSYAKWGFMGGLVYMFFFTDDRD